MPFKKGDPNINRAGRPKKSFTWADVLDKIGEEKIRSGEGNISKTGITKLGAREGHDLLDIPYTNPGSPTNNNNGIVPFNADETGTTKDPKLVVEHSAGGGGGGEVTPQSIIWFK